MIVLYVCNARLLELSWYKFKSGVKRSKGWLSDSIDTIRTNKQVVVDIQTFTNNTYWLNSGHLGVRYDKERHANNIHTDPYYISRPRKNLMFIGKTQPHDTCFFFSSASFEHLTPIGRFDLTWVFLFVIQQLKNGGHAFIPYFCVITINVQYVSCHDTCVYLLLLRRWWITQFQCVQ